MLENNSHTSDVILAPEEILGPPKVDFIGLGIMVLLALVVGFVSSIGVVVASFLSLGRFSLESGVAPVLLSMITFFALTVSNMIYLWWARAIFPHIYSGTRTVFLHISVFSVILFILMVPIYMMSPVSMNNSSIGILVAYIFHVLLNVFGIEVIISLLSGFRYTLLSIYASLSGFTLTAGVVFFIYRQMGSSSTGSLFMLLWLGALSFVLSIFVVCVVRLLYYRYYLASGSDPIGNTFAQVEQDEREYEKLAENQLLWK